MRVNRFKVKWSYTDVELHRGKTTRKTNCRIEENGKIISSAEITKYLEDVDDKNLARKISLGKALQTFPKSQRKEFWETYRTLTKNPRW